MTGGCVKRSRAQSVVRLMPILAPHSSGSGCRGRAADARAAIARSSPIGRHGTACSSMALSKSERDNIDGRELDDLKKLAKQLLN